LKRRPTLPAVALGWRRGAAGALPGRAPAEATHIPTPPQSSSRLSDFTELGRIGEGTYGVVLRCRDKATGETVAVKCFKEGTESNSVSAVGRGGEREKESAGRWLTNARPWRPVAGRSVHEAPARHARLELAQPMAPLPVRTGGQFGGRKVAPRGGDFWG